jgi:hypothetical protein
MSTTPQQAQQEFMADLRRSGEVWPAQAAPDPDEPSTCVTSVALVAVALSIVVPCLVIVFTSARKPCIPASARRHILARPAVRGCKNLTNGLPKAGFLRPPHRVL